MCVAKAIGGKGLAIGFSPQLAHISPFFNQMT